MCYFCKTFFNKECDTDFNNLCKFKISCFNLFFHLNLRVAFCYNLSFYKFSYPCINFLSITILGYNSYLQKIKCIKNMESDWTHLD